MNKKITIRDAVSYTHLDVYKRQVGKGPGLLAEGLHGDFCSHHRHLVFAEL